MWKFVSVGAIIGGLVSVFVLSNYMLAFICVVALIISVFMEDEDDLKLDKKRKELIKKYYNIYGDRLLESDELKKELAKKIGHIGPINQRQLNILNLKIHEYIWSLEDKE